MKLIELAYVIAPHGIKGAALLNLYNQENSILKSGLEVWLTPADKSTLPKEGLKIKIDKIQIGHKTIATFQGINDRNTIEAWLPFKVSVSRDQFPQAAVDEIYLADLMGLEVFAENGKKVGKITGTFNHGSVDIIEILTTEGEELTLPFKSQFFQSIDLTAKRVVISDVDYL